VIAKTIPTKPKKASHPLVSRIDSMVVLNQNANAINSATQKNRTIPRI